MNINDEIPICDAVSRTVAVTKEFSNNCAARGLMVFLKGVAGSGSVTSVEVQVNIGGTWTTLYQFASVALSTTGTKKLFLYPGTQDTAGWDVKLAGALPARFRIQITPTDGTAYTYSASAHLIQ